MAHLREVFESSDEMPGGWHVDNGLNMTQKNDKKEKVVDVMEGGDFPAQEESKLAWKFVDSEGALLRMAPGQPLQIYRIGGKWADWPNYRDWFHGTPLDPYRAEALVAWIEKMALERAQDSQSSPPAPH